jgi:predicted flap endonuclease-1-like 5' DNA nuclease
MARIIDIEGIGPSYKQALKEKADITTTEALLEACATPKQRDELAAKTKISVRLILKWANMADLFRIDGVGEEYSQLLEAAGVDTVIELAKRNTENLHAALQETNAKKKLVRRLPTVEQVKAWIEQAKKLPRKLTY